ncbi:hypothetical protein HanRHA438_Chr15g0707781 [Helianthus annuus]|nr:hypothetical protein HanRHA438_Chr15g0707781 [Helianthus annuus]
MNSHHHRLVAAAHDGDKDDRERYGKKGAVKLQRAAAVATAAPRRAAVVLVSLARFVFEGFAGDRNSFHVHGTFVFGIFPILLFQSSLTFVSTQESAVRT